MRNISALIPLLAALYHEAVRAAVTSGNTLANAVGQQTKFTEYPQVLDDVRRGREMTAERLLERFDFTAKPRTVPPTKIPQPQVNAFAVSLHEAERAAVEAGLVAKKLNPPQPWVPFDGLPPQAQEGRRLAARWLLERFTVTPLDPAAGVPPPPVATTSREAGEQGPTSGG